MRRTRSIWRRMSGGERTDPPPSTAGQGIAGEYRYRPSDAPGPPHGGGVSEATTPFTKQRFGLVGCDVTQLDTMADIVGFVGFPKGVNERSIFRPLQARR